MVDRVVEEQDLCRLHQNGGKGQQSVAHQEVHARFQDIGQAHADGSDDEDGQNGQDCADDAHREVIDDHLEAGGNMAFHLLDKLLDAPASQRAADHSADKHGAVSGCNCAQSSQGAGDRSLLASDRPAAGVTNQNRQQILEHGSYHTRDGCIGEPALLNEERGDESPRDEGSDVRHDHTGQEPSKLLDILFHSVFFLS